MDKQRGLIIIGFGGIGKTEMVEFIKHGVEFMTVEEAKKSGLFPKDPDPFPVVAAPLLPEYKVPALSGQEKRRQNRKKRKKKK